MLNFVYTLLHSHAAKDNPDIATKLYRGDLCSLPDVQGALRGATAVIHNASIVDVTSLPDYDKIYRVNVLGTYKKMTGVLEPYRSQRNLRAFLQKLDYKFYTLKKESPHSYEGSKFQLE